MSQQVGYPIGTTSNDWTVVGAATAHQATDEAYPPGNRADYVEVGGFTSDKRVRLVMDPGELTSKVTRYQVVLDMSGEDLSIAPAMRLELFVAGALKGSYPFQCDTFGNWEELTINFNNLNIIGTDWYAGPIELLIIPIDGSGGYELP